MDRRERADDLGVAALTMLEGWQADLWTALPCQVESFDAITQTASLQPLIQARVQQQDGSWRWETGPLLTDVPVHFPRGGGYALTFPVAAGDEALVVFASRCIDAWWQSGGVQPQLEQRMHDLSDGMAFVGFSSVPNAISALSTTTTQLRSLDGREYVEVGASQLKLVHPVKVLFDAPLGEFTGDMQVDGLITGKNGLAVTAGSNGAAISGDLAINSGTITITGGDITADGISLKSHLTSGVTPGTGTSGVPVA